MIRLATCIVLALATAAAAVPVRHPHHTPAKPPPAPPPPNVVLVPREAQLIITPPAITASGTVTLAFQSIAPQNVILRIQPQKQGDPPPRIAWGVPAIEQRSPPLGQLCQSPAPCVVPYTVLHVGSAGTQDLRLEAHDASDTTRLLGSADLRVLREKLPVHVELSRDGVVVGDVMVLSLLRTRDFIFHLKNPADGEAIVPIIGAALPACPDQPPRKIISFSLTDAALERGAETTFHAKVDPCVRKRLDSLVLRITDQNQAGAEIFARPLIVDPAAPFGVLGRWLPSWQILYVLVGAVASIMLNNFFPFQRSRRTLRQFLVHSEATLNDCANLSTGLADALAAQVAACHAALDALSVFWPSKTRLLGDIQTTISALDATLKVARELDQHRATLQSKEDFLSTLSCTTIAARLLDAEDALLAGDPAAAGIAMAEAQRRFDAIFADTEQVALRADLNKRLIALEKELDTLSGQPAHGRNTDIRHIAKNLEKSVTHPAPAAAPPLNPAPPARALPQDATLEEMLSIERDIFVIETWFASIEPRLQSEPDRFAPFWEELHRALVMAPKCVKTRMMLGLVRADTTPHDIMESLYKYGARIDCANRPYYYIINNFRVVLNDPLLACVQAVRHFIDYSWVFDAEYTARSRTFQCWYFFRPRRLPFLPRPAFVTVTLQVPFTTGALKLPARHVRPRHVKGEKSYAISESISFSVFTMAAIASAYLTKYPDSSGIGATTLSLQDIVTALLFGFGIDQLRDTITNQASTRLSPAAPTAPGAATT